MCGRWGGVGQRVVLRHAQHATGDLQWVAARAPQRSAALVLGARGPTVHKNQFRQRTGWYLVSSGVCRIADKFAQSGSIHTELVPVSIQFPRPKTHHPFLPRHPNVRIWGS